MAQALAPVVGPPQETGGAATLEELRVQGTLAELHAEAEAEGFAGTGAEEVAAMCKSQLDEAAGPMQRADHQQLQWWDAWAVRWLDEFLPAGRVRDEHAKTSEARRVRKACKEQKLTQRETAQQVERALLELEFVVPPAQAPKIPVIEDKFAQEQLAVYERRAREAARRLESIVRRQEDKKKADNEAAVRKATQADARLKVSGKQPYHVAALKLPVSDWKLLRKGTGVRKGVTTFMGGLLEEYRQKEHLEGQLMLRQKGVDDEWAGQIGNALLKSLCSLHTLDLACNTFGDPGTRDLAVGISKASTLTSLDLGCNKIDRQGLDYLADAILVNSAITVLSLNSLKFGDNLRNVPLPKADDVDESEEDEDEDEEDRLAREKQEREKREQESLEKEQAAKPKKLTQAEKEKERLRKLYGRKTPPPPPKTPEKEFEPGLGRMLETLVLTKNLRKLDFGGNRMGPVLFGNFCDSLSLNQTLRWINVSGNCLGADGGAHLGRLLATTPRLQYLDACSNFFGAEGADYLSLQIDTNTGLTDLRLSSNRMSAQGSPWLGQILKYLPNLTALDIAGNDVDEVSSGAVHEALEGSFTNLTSLKLSQNPFGDKGIQTIALGLAGLPLLRSLQLFNCEITDAGAAVIGAAAASMPNLRALEVAFNRISDDGFRLMTECLLVAGARFRLTELNISGNVCEDPVTEHLARLLQKGPFLQRLSLRGNFLTMAGLLRMIELTQAHENLTHVDLRGNVSKDDAAAQQELDYLSHILEQRNCLLQQEQLESTLNIADTPLFSAQTLGAIMTPGMTSLATPLQLSGVGALYMGGHNRVQQSSLPIAVQIRLARKLANSSPRAGASPLRAVVD